MGKGAKGGTAVKGDVEGGSGACERAGRRRRRSWWGGGDGALQRVRHY